MEIDNSQYIIDVRDVIARVEELEDEATQLPDGYELDPVVGGYIWKCTDKDVGSDRFDSEDEATRAAWAHENPEEVQELATLTELLSDLAGSGGDEQWRGDWYPVALIRDSYFQDYAQELAEDIGAINPAATWPNNCIDWGQAARELRIDYSAVEFDGVTYWYR